MWFFPKRVLIGAAMFACALSSQAFAAGRGAYPDATRVPRPVVGQAAATRPGTNLSSAQAAGVQAKELVSNVSRAYPASCFSDIVPAPTDGTGLPSTPSGPLLYSGTVTLYAVNTQGQSGTVYTEDVTITIWRVPCSSSGDALTYNPDKGPVSATLMRIQRQSQYEGDNVFYPTFPAVAVAQGNVGFDDPKGLDLPRVAPEPNTVVADVNASHGFDFPIVYSATFVLENYPYSTTGFFYFNNAFKIRFDNFVNQSGITRQFVGSIPDYSPTQQTYPAAFAPMPVNGYLTGSWYDTAHGGEGILTQVLDKDSQTRTLFVTWYTFDNAGIPFWLVAQADFPIGTTQLQNVPVFYGTGGGFAGNFTPPITRTSWGTMNISFPDCQHIQFSYNGATSTINGGPGGSGQRNWSRLGAINSLNCQ